jgi:hypothetical protein
MPIAPRMVPRVLAGALVVTVVALFAAPAGALADPSEWGDTFCEQGESLDSSGELSAVLETLPACAALNRLATGG